MASTVAGLSEIDPEISEDPAAWPTVWRTTLVEAGMAPLYTRMVISDLPRREPA